MISPEIDLVKNEQGVWVKDTTEDTLREILGNDPPIILERKTMGMLVQVSQVAEGKASYRFILECETNAAHKIVEIPDNKILDAFYHPCLYVDEPNDLFPRSKS